MRELTAPELVTLIENGSCPFCHGKVFRFGPRGAASINLFCYTERCEAGFNICLPIFPAQLIKEPKWRR